MKPVLLVQDGTLGGQALDNGLWSDTAGMEIPAGAL